MAWDPDAFAALWQLYDSTGIRPEWALAAMNAESGLHTTAVNGTTGCAGLFQWCNAPSDFTSWSASQQILGGALPFWRSMVQRYGAIQSGAQLEQGNFYPASLKYARNPGDVIVSSKSDYGAWADNAGAFDPGRIGFITVQGVANFVARQLNANRAFFNSILAQTYALRPSEVPTDPVWGATQSWSRAKKVAVIAGVAALTGLAVWYWPEEKFTLKRLLRA